MGSARPVGWFVLAALVVLTVLLVLTLGEPEGAAVPAHDAGAVASGPDAEVTSHADVVSDTNAPDAPATASDVDDAATPVEALTWDAAPRARLRVVRWPDGRSVPGARVSVATEAGIVVRDALTSVGGALDVPLPRETVRVDLVAEAPGFERLELTLARVPTARETVLVELTPLTGYVGRVVTSLGQGLARMRVDARLFWTPRPTLLGEDDPRIVSIQGEASLPELTTNGEGYFYVEPFATENVVDLVLAVVGTEFASVPLHVPMPQPDRWLPDLVALGSVPLRGRIQDPFGNPVAGVLDVDRGLGSEREVEEQVATAADGTFALARHLGPQHLRAIREDYWFASAHSGAELPVDDKTWIELDGGVTSVVIVLAAGGRVRGDVRDDRSEAPVRDLSVVLKELSPQGQWVDVDRAFAPEGRFDLAVPPERLHAAVGVVLEAPGYAPVEESAWIETDSHAIPPVYYMSRAAILPRVVAGMVVDLGEVGQDRVDTTIRAWTSHHAEAMRVDPLREPLSERFDLIWEGRSERGFFSFGTSAPPSDTLVVLAERLRPDGSLALAAWGPYSVSTAGTEGIALWLEPPQALDVHVKGSAPGYGAFINRIDWLPWSQETLTSRTWLAAHTEAQHVTALVPAAGYAYLDVRVDRGPVAGVVARWADWLDLASHDLTRRLELEIRPLHQVRGAIPWYGPADWPDLCVALVGAAVPEWRAESLGENDWCTRPDPTGRFRFDGVPGGDYLLMLYEPVGTEGVEVLAQSAVTVRQDLFNLDIWPQRPGSATRVTAYGR